MRKTRKLLFGISTTVISILLFFIALEIILRIFFPIPTYGFSKGLFQSHNNLDYVLTPNFEGPHTGADFSTTIKINSQGLRDIEHNEEKTKKRLLIIGDSFPFGNGVEFEETFGYLLDEKLPNTEVIKAGVPGYGTDNEYEFLKEEGLNYDPDVIILVYSLNDLFDNLEKGEYVVENGFLIFKGSAGSSNKPIVRIHRWKLRHFMSYNFIYQNLRGMLDKYVRKVHDVKDSKYYDLYLAEDTEVYLNQFEQTEYHLNKIKEISDSANAQLILAVVAHRNNLLPELQEKYESYAAELNSETDPMKLTNDLKEFADSSNILFIDLHESFLNKDLEPLFLPIDGHWTPEGHELVSEQIYETLINENIVN